MSCYLVFIIIIVVKVEKGGNLTFLGYTIGIKDSTKNLVGRYLRVCVCVWLTVSVWRTIRRIMRMICLIISFVETLNESYEVPLFCFNLHSHGECESAWPKQFKKVILCTAAQSINQLPTAQRINLNPQAQTKRLSRWKEKEGNLYMLIDLKRKIKKLFILLCEYSYYTTTKKETR